MAPVDDQIGRTVIVDCRWTGHSGVGRVTQFLLEGLMHVQPSGRWLLWGPSDVEKYLWEGARLILNETSPLAMGAQRDVLSVPKGDQILFVHAVRPLVVRAGTAVLVHDVIPARYSESARRRLAWRIFFTLSTFLAKTIFVYSQATNDRVVNFLGVNPDKVRRLTLPFDRSFAARIRARRAASAAPRTEILYVGRATNHKNLFRALLAYARSSFAQSGGSFTLILPPGKDADAVVAFAELERIPRVQVLPPCSDAELVEFYAAALLVIQPSLEEGYGLIVVEALAGGVPVCCSRGGAMEEVARGEAVLFDPLSILSITSAIDQTARMAATETDDDRLRRFDDLPAPPTTAEFASQVLHGLAAAREP